MARQGAVIAQNLAQKQTLTTNATNDPFVQKFTQLHSKEHQVIQKLTPQHQEQENVGLANLYFSNETNGKDCETDMHSHSWDPGGLTGTCAQFSCAKGGMASYKEYCFPVLKEVWLAIKSTARHIIAY